MKTSFIFSYVDNDEEGIYRDLSAPQNKAIIEYLPSHVQFTNKYMEKIKKILLSNKVRNTFAGEFFQSALANLDKYSYQKDTQYYILIPSTSVGLLSIKYLERFKKRHPNTKLFPILTDSMHASSPHMNSVRPKLFSSVWEKVLTFDKYDAAEYGFTWFGYSWYSGFYEINPAEEKVDLFYIGYKKGNREKLIAQVYNEAEKKGIKCDFRLVSNEEGKIIEESDLQYTQKKYRYPEVVSQIKSSNCILEVLQKGQETQTIKYYEAVVYGKKLLTNYTNLQELPYYNSQRMRFFSCVEDIDWDWVRKEEDLEYGYHNEFSPLMIVEFLKDLYKIS